MVPLVLAAVLAATPSWSDRAPAVTLGAGLHLDDGTMRGTDRRSVLVTDETFDFSNAGKLYGSLGVSLAAAENVRVGVVGRYLGRYDYRPRMGETQAAARTLGNVLEVAIDGELLLPLVPRWQVALGAQGGLAVLFPGGDFEGEIHTLRRQGAGVWDVPRLGYLVGPRVGARWALTDAVFVRADLDLTWCQTFLFLTREEVAGVAFEKTRRANVIREMFGLSLEVPL